MREPSRLDLRGRLKFLLRDSLVYGAAAALAKALSLVTFPLLARHFSLEDYGLIDLVTAFILVLSTLLTFGMDSAMARYFYETEDMEQRRQVVSQAFFFVLVVLLVVLPLMWIGADRAVAILSLGQQGREVLGIVIAQMPFFVMTNMTMGLLKWTFKRNAFLGVSLGGTVTSVALIVVAVMWLDARVKDVFLIYLAVRVVTCLASLWLVRDWLVRPRGWTILRDMLPFAAPFGLICVVSAFIPLWERSVVQAMLGSADLGLLAAGSKVALLLSLFISAFETSWGPFSLALHKQPDAAATYRVVLKAVTITLLATVLAITTIGEPLVQLLGSARYAGASVVVFPMAACLVIQAVGSVAGVGITFSKRAHLYLYGYIPLLATVLVTAPWMADRFGLIGAAWASVFGYATKVTTDVVLAQRTHHIDWQFRSPLAVSVVALTFGVAHQATFGAYRAWGVDLVPLAGTACVLIVGWLVLLGPQERARIRRMVLRRRLAPVDQG